MRSLAKLSCVAMASCPEILDPEDGENIVAIGQRVSGHYPDKVGPGEEAVTISVKLLAEAGFVRTKPE